MPVDINVRIPKRCAERKHGTSVNFLGKIEVNSNQNRELKIIISYLLTSSKRFAIISLAKNENIRAAH